MIKISDTYIEKFLLEFLQNYVKLIINDKIWKEGKILLFKQKDYHIEFCIKKGKKKDFIEIPIPFDICTKKDSYLFDYTFKCLANNDKELINKLKQNDVRSKSKFYDTILKIEVKK